MDAERAGTARNLFSILELLSLLGVVPVLVMTVHIHAFRHGVLLAGCAYVVFRLYRVVSWRFLFQRPPAGWWRWPLARGTLVCILAVLYVQATAPQTLFQLPLERTGLWLLIIVAYPVLSVLPQELIYRVWLFEAHKSLWIVPAQPILVSAVFFGWVHIIYAGWFAVITCFAGGILLAWNYCSHRKAPGAIWPLVLEHALYGLTMFTVGLGRYFFLPR